MWTLQRSNAKGGLAMKIIETKDCSYNPGKTIKLVKTGTEETESGVTNQIAEYALNSYGCKLRFEIPEGESNDAYRRTIVVRYSGRPGKRHTTLPGPYPTAMSRTTTAC